MSELVEKVMTAIHTCEGHEEGFRNERAYSRVKAEARAAIAAVAEWLDEHQFYAERLCAKSLRAALRAAAGSAPTPPEVK